MFLPIRSKNPPESFPGVTCGLIAVNVVAYLATSDGFTVSRSVVDTVGEKGSNFSAVTILASMFLHGGIWHLVGNMWFLYLFGFAVEGRLRALKFSAVYFGSGLVASLADYLFWGQFNPDTPSIGASGAVMGVVGAALYLFPFAKIQFLYGWWEWWSAGFVDIPMWGVALMYLGLDVLLALLTGHTGGDGTAHFAHIGGTVGGLAICAIFLPRRDSWRASEAKAIYAESRDLRTLSRTDLADMHQANPEDTTVLLNWMMMCLEENRLTVECRVAFVAALPRIIEEQPVLSVASSISMLGIVSDCILPSTFVEVGIRVELSGNPSTALQLYDHALRDTRIKPNDEACALFRSAFIYEVKVGNPDAARNWYEELVRRHPMTPWADQANLRLSIMKTAP